MTTEAQREQQLRREILRNDLLLRQASTFHAFAQADAEVPQGRFAATNKTQVVGANALPIYPAAAPHQHDPCGPEPELGYRIDDMPELEPTREPAAQEAGEPTDMDAVGSPRNSPLGPPALPAQAPDAPAVAPPTPLGTGASFSSGDAAAAPSSHPPSVENVVERPALPLSSRPYRRF
jgi:hypothetical protein